MNAAIEDDAESLTSPIPDAVLDVIFLFLSPSELARASRACARWSSVGGTERLWRILARRAVTLHLPDYDAQYEQLVESRWLARRSRRTERSLRSSARAAATLARWSASVRVGGAGGASALPQLSTTPDDDEDEDVNSDTDSELDAIDTRAAQAASLLTSPRARTIVQHQHEHHHHQRHRNNNNHNNNSSSIAGSGVVAAAIAEVAYAADKEGGAGVGRTGVRRRGRKQTALYRLEAASSRASELVLWRTAATAAVAEAAAATTTNATTTSTTSTLPLIFSPARIAFPTLPLLRCSGVYAARFEYVRKGVRDLFHPHPDTVLRCVYHRVLAFREDGEVFYATSPGEVGAAVRDFRAVDARREAELTRGVPITLVRDVLKSLGPHPEVVGLRAPVRLGELPPEAGGGQQQLAAANTAAANTVLSKPLPPRADRGDKSTGRGSWRRSGNMISLDVAMLGGITLSRWALRFEGFEGDGMSIPPGARLVVDAAALLERDHRRGQGRGRGGNDGDDNENIRFEETAMMALEGVTFIWQEAPVLGGAPW